jgi:cell division protein FtsN
MGLQRSAFRQQGGTTAGLIIGLIIGLLIAVGIAMTIMKTPLPFIDKIGKPSQSGGDLGDPNKSLQSNARESRDTASSNSVPTPAPPAPAVELKRSPTSAPTPPVSSRQNEKPTTNPAPESSSAGSSGFTYYLQAGAFRERQDAEATKARLALMGVAATIAERKSELGTLYRVRVGPFDDIEGMNRARVRLSDNGVDAAVVRVPK